jgi:hypothetical protein
MMPGYNRLFKHMGAGALAGAALAGAALPAEDFKDRLQNARAGAILGAMIGARVSSINQYRSRTGSGNYRYNYRQPPPPPASFSLYEASQIFKTDLSKAKTKKEVIKAYRDAMKRHHPDLNLNNRAAAEEASKKINDAMDRIKETAWFNKPAEYQL